MSESGLEVDRGPEPPRGGSSELVRSASVATPRRETSLAPRRDGSLPAAGSQGLFALARSVLAGVLRFLYWLVIEPFVSAEVWIGTQHRRARLGPVLRVVALLALVVLGLWAAAHPLIAGASAAALLSLGGWFFVSRAAARNAMLLAATRELDAPPLTASSVRASRYSPARALEQLALAVDGARRGDLVSASRALTDVEPSHLEPDERRMLHAVIAITSYGMGDKRAASRAALEAFPTGVPSIDETVARYSLESAWFDPLRLAAILKEWHRRGVDPHDETPLAKLYRLGLCKLNQVDRARLPEAPRAELVALARAFSDERLVEDLEADASGRPLSYR